QSGGAGSAGERRATAADRDDHADSAGDDGEGEDVEVAGQLHWGIGAAGGAIWQDDVDSGRIDADVVSDDNAAAGGADQFADECGGGASAGGERYSGAADCGAVLLGGGCGEGFERFYETVPRERD